MDGDQNDDRGEPCPNCERLERLVERLSERIAKLEAALEEARRDGKRQAAPFRRKAGPKPNPEPPGRKPGDDYGEHARRAIPEDVDETYDVPLPTCCPHCDGRDLRPTAVHEHYEIEIPRTPITRRFDIAFGTCDDCGRRVHGRHELQGSESVGAARVTLGPEAHAAITLLNKGLGLSHGRVAKLFADLFGIEIDRSTSTRSVLRTARRCEPAHTEIVTSVRGSPRNVADETGWRIGGGNGWLHVCVGTDATAVEIARSRAADVLANLVGWDYAGVLIHDGWAAHDRFVNARHQQCVAHVLRRCAELIETATAETVTFPRAVKQLLQRALSVRDRRDVGELIPHGVASLLGRLRSELADLVAPTRPDAANERLAAHLERHWCEWLVFLEESDVDATNWRAEQAIRPSVVNRKTWGGNRTETGARAQSILTSVLLTCHQRAVDALEFLANTLRATTQSPLLIIGR